MKNFLRLRQYPLNYNPLEMPTPTEVRAIRGYKLFPDDWEIEPNLVQRRGCGNDVKVLPPNLTSFLTEIKHDKESVATGNSFVEYEQTIDNRKTWELSGLSLAAQQSLLYIHVMYKQLPNNSYVAVVAPFVSALLFETCQKVNFKTTETKNNKNGNKDGAYAKGWLVPFSGKSKYNWGDYGYLDFLDFYNKVNKIK